MISFQRALLALVVLGASSCATVRPYQRGRLAESHMQLDRDGQRQAMEQHVYEYREGATGATGTKGGGCGCN